MVDEVGVVDEERGVVMAGPRWRWWWPAMVEEEEEGDGG